MTRMEAERLAMEANKLRNGHWFAVQEYGEWVVREHRPIHWLKERRS